MRAVVAYPGGGGFAQQAALAFQEAGALGAYVTTLAHRPGGALARTLALLPPAVRRGLEAELARRTVILDPAKVRSHPTWELLRVAASRAGASPVLVDRVWDRLSRAFDRTVAERYVPGADVVYAYEYTALATFERARRDGVTTVLDLPSLSSRAYQALQREARERHPELRTPHDGYFDARFAARQARRDREIELADVIVTNSRLTMRSHVEAGADPAKFVVTPLAAPPAIGAVRRDFAPDRPLSALWAGAFQLRKGAHVLVSALQGHPCLRVDVYGSVQLPGDAQAAAGGLVFHGPSPQPRVFAAMEAADVLVFPTLSDGFGLVVVEAFAHGLPVITTESAGAAELVRHGENGLVIPAGDPAALREALQWCLDNRLRLHEMRAAALATAKAWQWSDYRPALMAQLAPRLCPP
jgi:glycosyltransferase involved in cell wall biosynthesis